MPSDRPGSSSTRGALPQPDDKERHWLWSPCAYTLASTWVVVWVACAIWMALGTLVAKQSHDRLNEMRHALIEEATKAGHTDGSSLLSIDEAVAVLDSREQFLASLRTYELERLEVVSEIGRLELVVKDAQDDDARLRRQADDGLEPEMGSRAGAAVFRPLSVQSVATAGSGETLAEADQGQIGALAQLQLARTREAGLAARMAYLQTRLDQLTLAPALELLAKDVRCVSSMLGIFFYLPSYLVTLMLTLAMGALGSAIFITHKLFKRELLGKHVSWYVIRPFHGMTLALAMYILVRAGQFAMTDPSGGIGDLNPFSIAFIGIISGLLSEQVYDGIRLAGERLVNGGSAPPKGAATPGQVT